jgi:hypothetical protein
MLGVPTLKSITATPLRSRSFICATGEMPA